MANTKKNVQNDNVDNEVTNNNSNINIDIEALIKSAVEKAVNETSLKYQDKISELQNKLSEVNNTKVESINNFEETETIETASMKPDRMVRIMHMGLGGATFRKGRVNVRFEKLFDERRIRFEMLDEMYYTYNNWFNNFEIVILDKDVREYYGIEYNFKESGADKNKFYQILKLPTDDMLKEVSKLKGIVVLSFLKFFLDQYLNNNEDTLKSNKFNALQDHYHKKYGMEKFQNIIEEMRQENN